MTIAHLMPATPAGAQPLRAGAAAPLAGWLQRLIGACAARYAAARDAAMLSTLDGRIRADAGLPHSASAPRRAGFWLV